MITYVYKKCAWILSRKPLMLWGLSLLCALLTKLASIFGILPIISMPIGFALEAGMVMIYIDGYNGKNVNSDQLFKGFTNFAHVAGGMAWRALWQLIWGMISGISMIVLLVAGVGAAAGAFINRLRMSLGAYGAMDSYGYGMQGPSILSIIICFFMAVLAIAGIVVVVIKMYSYRFTPYILMSKPEVSATEALRMSMRQTKGHKGTLFLADFLCGVAMFLAVTVFLLFANIPYVGGFFAVILGIVLILLCLVFPLFIGLVRAGLYLEITNSTAPGQGSYAGNPQPNGPTAPGSTPGPQTPFFTGAPTGTPFTPVTPSAPKPTAQAPFTPVPPAEPKATAQEPFTPVPPVAPTATPDQAPFTMEKPVTPATSAISAEAPFTPETEAPKVKPSGMIFCTGCGNSMRPEQKFCPKCGKPRQ